MKLKKNLDLNRESLRVLNHEEKETVNGAYYANRCSGDTASVVTTRRIYCC